jgi:uncharacterized protein YbaR (Trm112 family)
METSLLELLCAPLTHASLRLAHGEELRSINRVVGLGLLRNRAGELLQTELEACLICDADRICYPVRDGFPVLIPDAGFHFPGEAVPQTREM